MSEYNLLNRWTIKRKTFWWLVGGSIGGIIILAFLLLILLPIPMMSSADYYNDYDTGYSVMNSSDDAYFAEESMEKGMVGVDSMSAAPQAYDGAIVHTAYPERMIIREGNITVPVDYFGSFRF